MLRTDVISSMPKSDKRNRSVDRKIIAVLALCLFAMKALSFLGMAASPAGTPVTGELALAQDDVQPYCESRDKQADPKRENRHRSECCILCISARRDIAPPSFFILVALVAEPPGERARPTNLAIEATTPLSAPGLKSNWSATSPPALLRS
jgi:hypothetical protein